MDDIEKLAAEKAKLEAEIAQLKAKQTAKPPQDMTDSELWAELERHCQRPAFVLPPPTPAPLGLAPKPERRTDDGFRWMMSRMFPDSTRWTRQEMVANVVKAMIGDFT